LARVVYTLLTLMLVNGAGLAAANGALADACGECCDDATGGRDTSTAAVEHQGCNDEAPATPCSPGCDDCVCCVHPVPPVFAQPPARPSGLELVPGLVPPAAVPPSALVRGVFHPPRGAASPVIR
jgi:hypothetical protein